MIPKKLKIKDQIKKDLERLDAPLIGGMYNLCYGDNYFAKSLTSKYGMSLKELRERVKE